MRNYSYRLLWSDDDACYVATVPEFPELSGFGATAHEALNELDVALEAALEIHEEEGWPLPDPYQLQSHSGQFRLRLPRTVHARLAERAQQEGVSLNSLAATYVVQGLASGEVLGAARLASKELASYRALLRIVTDAFEQVTSNAETAVVGGFEPSGVEVDSVKTYTASTTIQADPLVH